MDLYFSPYDYAFHNDPYPLYARLRAEAPVYRNDELDFWALSRYDDVATAFREYAAFSNSNGVMIEPSVWGPDAWKFISAALGEPLPYPDNAFDLIVCALAIHYARDRAAAFAEFCRVLRPGGAAVVSTQHPVMDWLRKGGSYFQATLETDIWHTPSGDQPVHFWREPLSALCTAATGTGFLIEKLIEPVPAETMRERYPEDYEKLSKEPGFLILHLLKPAGPNPSPRS